MLKTLLNKLRDTKCLTGYVELKERMRLKTHHLVKISFTAHNPESIPPPPPTPPKKVIDIKHLQVQV